MGSKNYNRTAPVIVDMTDNVFCRIDLNMLRASTLEPVADKTSPSFLVVTRRRNLCKSSQ